VYDPWTTLVLAGLNRNLHSIEINSVRIVPSEWSAAGMRTTLRWPAPQALATLVVANHDGGEFIRHTLNIPGLNATELGGHRETYKSLSAEF